MSEYGRSARLLWLHKYRNSRLTPLCPIEALLFERSELRYGDDVNRPQFGDIELARGAAQLKLYADELIHV